MCEPHENLWATNSKPYDRSNEDPMDFQDRFAVSYFKIGREQILENVFVERVPKVCLESLEHRSKLKLN